MILTLNLLTTTIVAPPSNASKWQMGFNSAFKGLIYQQNEILSTLSYMFRCLLYHLQGERYYIPRPLLLSLIADFEMYYV
jgi:hypothetical protein